MNSTWRSGESRGYCDLHRRGLDDLEELCGIATRSDGRRNDACELGERFITEGEGVSRGNVLVLGRLEAVPLPGDDASSDGRCGKVEAIFSGP